MMNPQIFIQNAILEQKIEMFKNLILLVKLNWIKKQKDNIIKKYTILKSGFKDVKL